MSDDILRQFHNCGVVCRGPDGTDWPAGEIKNGVVDEIERCRAEIAHLRRWQLSCKERAAIDRVLQRMSVLAAEGRTWPEIETFREMVARFPISYEENTEKRGDSNMTGGTNE